MLFTRSEYLIRTSEVFRCGIVMVNLVAGMYSDVAQASENSLRGKFTFNWFTNPSKTKCVPVDGRLVSKFNSREFECHAGRNTASGVPAWICSAADGRSEYMIFSTMASCENERKTQAANGD